MNNELLVITTCTSFVYPNRADTLLLNFFKRLLGFDLDNRVVRYLHSGYIVRIAPQ